MLMAIALPTFSPLVIVSGRMVVASVLLNGVIFSQGQRWPRDRWVWLECAGLSLVSNLLPFGLVVWGQQYIDASLAAILIAASPVFTVAIASLLGLERLTLTRGLGVLMGFAGVVVLIGPQVLQGFSLKGAGELAMLAAALSYSVAGFWGRRFKRIRAELVSTMTITMGTLLVVPLALLVERPLAQLGGGGSAVWGAGLAVVGLGVFSTAIAYIIYFRLLAEMGVVNTSLVSFLVPLSAVLMSAIFLQERLSLPAIVGMSLILGGLAVLDGRLLKQLHS